MTWDDPEDIALALMEKFPGQDPLEVRFTDLRDRVLAFTGFTGTREECSERKLEAIQMAWHEEWQDR